MLKSALRRLPLLAAALGCFALLVGAGLALAPLAGPQNRDFFKFWLAGRLILEGGDPQRAADWVAGHERYGSTWLPEQASLYPLPLALLLTPLGLPPVELAFALLFAASIALTLGAVLLTMGLWPRAIRRPYLLPLIAAAALFRPLLITLWLGQISALFLAILAGALWCWERGRWRLGGAALALMALKPSLGGPLIALLGLWLIARRRPGALAGLAAGLAGLLLLGALHTPAWALRFLEIGGERLSSRLGTTPNLWGLGRLACGGEPGCTVIAGAGLAALALAAAAALLWGRMGALTPGQAVSWAAPLALLVTPYTYVYDQLILLAPVVVITLGLAQRGAPFLAAASAPLGLAALALACSLPGERAGHDILSVGVPLAALAAAATFARGDRPGAPRLAAGRARVGEPRAGPRG